MLARSVMLTLPVLGILAVLLVGMACAYRRGVRDGWQRGRSDLLRHMIVHRPSFQAKWDRAQADARDPNAPTYSLADIRRRLRVEPFDQEAEA